MKHGRGFAQTVQNQVKTVPAVLAVQTMSEALNLEAAMLGVWLGAWLGCALWLGVHSVVCSVCTRYRASARACAGACGRRSFLV